MPEATAQFTLLNTRPSHQADALTQSIQAMQGVVLCCPTLKVVGLAPPLLAKAVQSLPKGMDKIIFISANAVEGFVSNQLEERLVEQSEDKEGNASTSPIFYAIGRATQQVGERQGIPLKRLSNSQFDSESFLAHKEMHSIAHQAILIVKGRGGRSHLQETLLTRGAEVHCLDVYERVATEFCQQAWQEFMISHRPMLLITSMDSFERLIEGAAGVHKDFSTLNNQAWLFIETTLVFSARIQKEMQRRGWIGSIQVVEEQSNQGIGHAIHTHLTLNQQAVDHGK
ncbi:MAG: uroporphyrinogen-III synthase [Gammaproteobacteria bacterium]|nr:uroporphyrinogen-III synthase [Gammaproteobacteria bacterium]